MRACAAEALTLLFKRLVEHHLIIAVLCAVAHGCGGHRNGPRQLNIDFDAETNSRPSVLDSRAPEARIPRYENGLTAGIPLPPAFLEDHSRDANIWQFT